MQQTGRTLDEFLGRFGYAIRPNSTRRYAYSTDAVQRWPGLKPNGKKRDPSPREVANCAEWFEAGVGNSWATRHPQPATNQTGRQTAETAFLEGFADQPQPAATPDAYS